MVIAIMVLVSFFILIGMGKKFEVETRPIQFFSCGFCQNFILRYKQLKNISVLLEGIIDIPNQIAAGCILLIVEGISAAVIAEFLIHSTLNGFSAMETKSISLLHQLKSLNQFKKLGDNCFLSTDNLFEIKTTFSTSDPQIHRTERITL